MTAELTELDWLPDIRTVEDVPDWTLALATRALIAGYAIVGLTINAKPPQRSVRWGWSRSGFRKHQILHRTHWRKPNQPAGRKRIEWKLLTDLEVNSCKEAVEKVKWYAMRWKIEVFHKILKSGCRTEDARLRTAERLANWKITVTPECRSSFNSVCTIRAKA